MPYSLVCLINLGGIIDNLAGDFFLSFEISEVNSESDNPLQLDLWKQWLLMVICKIDKVEKSKGRQSGNKSVYMATVGTLGTLALQIQASQAGSFSLNFDFHL